MRPTRGMTGSAYRSNGCSIVEYDTSGPAVQLVMTCRQHISMRGRTDVRAGLGCSHFGSYSTLAHSRLLVLIAELDRREVWAAQGALSCAHWLSWACGIDTHTAREKVRVARALTGLPLLSAALAKGELGYSKVRALTRIATAENEADLLNIGLHGTAQHVEKFVRLYRRAKRAEETERADAQHEDRGLTFWHEDDGTVGLHGRFPPEMGARILSAAREVNWWEEYESPVFAFYMALGNGKVRYITCREWTSRSAENFPHDPLLSHRGNQSFYLGWVSSGDPRATWKTAQWTLIRALRPKLNEPPAPSPCPPGWDDQYCGSVCSWFYSLDGMEKREPPPGFPTVITFNAPDYDDPPDEERVLRLRLDGCA